MTARQNLALAAAVASLVVSSCAAPPTDDPSDPQDSATLAQTYGGCAAGSSPGEGPGPLTLLKGTKHLRLVGMAAAVPTERKHETVPWTVTTLEAVDGSTPIERRLWIHDSMFPGIAWAFENDADVLVGVDRGVEEDGEGLIAYTLVAPTGQDPFFLGSCQYDMLTEPLRRILGSGYRQEVLRLATSPVTPSPSTTPTQPTLLNPEAAPAELLAALDHVAVRFVVPQGWLGQDYTIASRIPEGWNAGISLSGLVDTDISSYLGESDLEIWLLDATANVAVPVTRLGLVPAAEVRAAMVDADAAVIEIEGPDLAEVVAGAQRTSVRLRE